MQRVSRCANTCRGATRGRFALLFYCYYTFPQTFAANLTQALSASSNHFSSVCSSSALIASSCVFHSASSV